jgi:hypothetical protein
MAAAVQGVPEILFMWEELKLLHLRMKFLNFFRFFQILNDFFKRNLKYQLDFY